MRLTLELEKYRIKKGPFRTEPHSKYGAFNLKIGSSKLLVLSSGEIDPEWEHVSVSLKNRCPSWNEMCTVKRLFWDEDDTVVQFHPRKTEYVNQHPNCLHLWKNRKIEHILPPKYMV